MDGRGDRPWSSRRFINAQHRPGALRCQTPRVAAEAVCACGQGQTSGQEIFALTAGDHFRAAPCRRATAAAGTAAPVLRRSHCLSAVTILACSIASATRRTAASGLGRGSCTCHSGLLVRCLRPAPPWCRAVGGPRRRERCNCHTVPIVRSRSVPPRATRRTAAPGRGLGSRAGYRAYAELSCRS